MTAEQIVSILKHVFARFGIPKLINTDNGSQFTSTVFREFLHGQGIQQTFSPFYAPFNNGGVERLNRFIKQNLRSHLNEGYSFQDALVAVLFAYRSTDHSLTGKSPAELMLGRHLRTPLHLIKPDKGDKKEKKALHVEVRKKQENLYRKINKNRHAPPVIKVGDWVRILHPAVAKNKWMSSLTAAQQVVKKLGSKCVLLSSGAKWHVKHCILSDGKGQSQAVSGEDVILPDQPLAPPEQKEATPQVPEPITVRRSERVTRRPDFYGVRA